MTDFVKGDTGSILKATCVDPSKTVIDLTGASVKLKWKDDEGTLVERTMTIDADPTTGIVTYQFQAGELQNNGMSFEIEITDAAAKILRNPDLIVTSVRENLS